MTDEFCEYLQAEVTAILDSMDEECRCDPARRTEAALIWIERNAASFRQRWQEIHLGTHHTVQAA